MIITVKWYPDDEDDDDDDDDEVYQMQPLIIEQTPYSIFITDYYSMQ